MPTYDYECSSCGHTYELFQSITAAPQKKCPSCKKNTAKRLIGTGGGIIFKGSGFYQTDYRSESYKKAAKADGEGASSSTGKESGTTASSTSESKKSDTAGKSSGDKNNKTGS